MAYSKPTPIAGPLIAPTMGLSSARAIFGVSSPLRRLAQLRTPLPWARSFRSRPEQKPRPAPVSTTAPAPGSSPARRSAALNSRPNPSFTAFMRSGRFSVITATRSTISNNTSGIRIAQYCGLANLARKTTRKRSILRRRGRGSVSIQEAQKQLDTAKKHLERVRIASFESKKIERRVSPGPSTPMRTAWSR